MEDKKKPVVCIICKMPIEAYQRPSVRLEAGKEVHAECYTRWQELERQRVN
jgi:hypothetical protein